MLDTDVAIETPEHIVFHYRVAGPARRALGHLLDLLLCYGAVAAFGLIVFLAAMRGADAGELSSMAKAGVGVILVALFAVQWIYFLVCEAVWGRSPGKMAVGVRVVTTLGKPIGWRAAALRNLLRAADLLPVGYLVGVVAMMLSGRFQRLGDLVAGTMVVAPENARVAKALKLSPAATPDELAGLPAHVILDAEERTAIELLLRRRHTLGHARSLELANMIAPQLAERTGAKHADPVRLLALLHDRATNAALTLTETAFAEARSADWEALDTLTKKKILAEDVARLSPLYRSVCADLAAAQAARYSATLVDYLRDLTATAHGVVYGPNARTNERGLFRRAWLTSFPRAVRKQKGAMLLATALFFLPLLLGALLTLREPSTAFRVVPEAMLRPLAEGYARGFTDGRDAGEGTMMAGFYIYNNIGIALRCFAMGIFGGLGSAFYLVQNGFSIGAILGYVASQGAGGNIGLFIIGHGSLELGAIVLAGGAGLSIGWSIIAPGELSRVESLQRRAREILVVIGGATVMLAMAAAIEGFWSASSAPNIVKLVTGGGLFLGVLGYILFAGRGDESSDATSSR